MQKIVLWLVMCILVLLTTKGALSAHKGPAALPANRSLYWGDALPSAAQLQTMTCAQCHGGTGNGYDSLGRDLVGPKISALDEAYFVKRLLDFSHQRIPSPQKGPVTLSTMMAVVCKHLTAPIFKAFAILYASFPRTAEHSTHPFAAALGKQLWTYGDTQRHIPACMACHGFDGRGYPSAFPALAGQKARYLEQSLRQWRSGERHSDPNAMMRMIAHRLNDAQIQALSQYAAGLTSQSVPVR